MYPPPMMMLAQSQPGAPPSHHAPPPPAQRRTLMRSDILALAAADAALGLRFMPPAAPMAASASASAAGARSGVGCFPSFPHYFVPPAAPSPSAAASAAAQPLSASERTRGRSRAGSGSATGTGVGGAAAQRGGWGRPAQSNAPLELPTRIAARRGAATASASQQQQQQSKSVARLSLPRSRRGSASKPGASASGPAPTPAPAVPAGPSAATASATVSAAPSVPTSPRGQLHAGHESVATAAAPSASRTPRSPRTPRTPRSTSQPGSRMVSPRSSVPNSPRSPRTPSRRLSASTRAAAAAACAGGNSNHGAQTQGQAKLMDESEVRRLMAQLLSEAGLAGEVLLDSDARSTARGPQLGLDRAARADLIAREEEERQRRLEEETRRPHYYMHRARSEASEFRQTLMPLLAQADRALERIEQRSSGDGVGDLGGIRSASLASNLSRGCAMLVARNADTLADMVLDALLADTVQVLNFVEEQKELDRVAKVDTNFLGDAWEAVQNFEAQRERLQEKYRLQGETCVRQHLPEISLDRSPPPLSRSAPAHAAVAAAAAPAASSPSPPFSGDLDTRQMRGPISAHQHQPFVPASASTISAAQQQRQQRSQQPQPQPAPPARSVYPPASTFITPSSVAAAGAAASSPLAAAASPPPVPVGFASLPSLPALVSSVQSDRAAFELHVAQRNQQQFLMPHQVQLHTIVAAAGDDILDSLLASVCMEVGDVCDKYVERVFDAEFEVDLEQMAEQDWNEQMQTQQEQQQQQQQEYPLQDYAPEQQPVQ